MVSPSGRSLRGSHQLAAFDACEYLANLRYFQRTVGRVDKPTRLRGTLIHLCMAYYYASKMSPDIQPAWFGQKDLHTALDEKGRGLPDGIFRALEVMTAYNEHYKDQKPVWTPMFIEDEFFATPRELDPAIDQEIETLSHRAEQEQNSEKRSQLEYHLAHLRHLKSFDDFPVSCRPDLIVKIMAATGPELWIVDHKSQGKAWGKGKGLRKWKDDGEYVLDWQVLVNLVVARAPSNVARLKGLPIKGFIINRMTREPDENGRYFFDHHILNVPHVAYTRTPRRMRAALAKELVVRQKVDNGILPDQNFWACQGRYGACDYRPLCSAKTQKAAYDLLQSDFIVEPGREDQVDDEED